MECNTLELEKGQPTIQQPPDITKCCDGPIIVCGTAHTYHAWLDDFVDEREIYKAQELDARLAKAERGR